MRIIEERKVKRRALLKALKQNGWHFKRHGGSHDIFSNGKKLLSVPRHREIPEETAKALIKQSEKG